MKTHFTIVKVTSNRKCAHIIDTDNNDLQKKQKKIICVRTPFLEFDYPEIKSFMDYVKVIRSK